MGVNGLDLSGSGLQQVSDCCQCNNKLLVSIKQCEFINYGFSSTVLHRVTELVTVLPVLTLC